MKILRHTIATGRGDGLSVQAVERASREIRVWGPRAIATVLWEIGTQFELVTGHQLDIESALADHYVRRLNSGEPFDVFVGMPCLVDQLIQEGRIIAASRTPLVRSEMGVEVRAGARRPDISSVETFKRTLMGAKSVGFLRVGGGDQVAAMLRRLGIANALASRITRPDTDIVSDLVAAGDVELGLVIKTQILTTPGVQFVGPFPTELKSSVEFVGGVSADAKAPHAAGELLRFLTGPIVRPVIELQGMDLAC